MARVPLIQEQERPELADMIERFRAGRRGKLINIYRMLLNAPPLAESWFNHSNTVRWKTTLPGRLREIVIVRMGHVTKSQYVLRQHVPSLAVADGGMRCAFGLGRLKILHRERARRPRLCRYHDPRNRGAGCGLRGARPPLQRQRDRRIDGAHWHLQYECARAAGPATRSRAAPAVSRAFRFHEHGGPEVLRFEDV